MASLDQADLKLKLNRTEGERRLVAAQKRLLALRLQLGGLLGDHRHGPPLCVLFEGWDAAGKGGAIRRLVSPLDPRHVRVAQFARPDRRGEAPPLPVAVQARLPGWGGMTVFDRSWYGRVLVERVEGLATEDGVDARLSRDQRASSRRWPTRAMVLVKFWLHVSEEEQLRRFGAASAIRSRVEAHRRGLAQPRTADGLRATAVEEMLERTDTPRRPGTSSPPSQSRMRAWRWSRS